MARIGIVAKVDHPATDLLKAIAPHASAGSAELAGRFKDGDLIVDLEYTGSDWEENHASLRAVVAELKERAIPFQLWESASEVSPLNGHRIEPAVLENILRTHFQAHEDALDEIDRRSREAHRRTGRGEGGLQ